MSPTVAANGGLATFSSSEPRALLLRLFKGDTIGFAVIELVDSLPFVDPRFEIPSFSYSLRKAASLIEETAAS